MVERTREPPAYVSLIPIASKQLMGGTLMPSWEQIIESATRPGGGDLGF